MITAAFFNTNGLISRILDVINDLTLSIFSFSITKGIIRIPASLSPGFTTVFECLVAIIICPNEFTVNKALRSTLNSP